jgi:hypothetical protein
MKLTAEQKRAIHGGQAIQVNMGGEACILLRKDVYERGEELDFSPWTPEEMDLLAAETADLLAQGERTNNVKIGKFCAFFGQNECMKSPVFSPFLFYVSIVFICRWLRENYADIFMSPSFARNCPHFPRFFDAFALPPGRRRVRRTGRLMNIQRGDVLKARFPHASCGRVPLRSLHLLHRADKVRMCPLISGMGGRHAPSL